MSSLVLGTAQFGLNYGINNKNGQLPIEQLLDVLELAWDNGIREIDTAQDYGNSEQVFLSFYFHCIYLSRYFFKNIYNTKEGSA